MRRATEFGQPTPRLSTDISTDMYGYRDKRLCIQHSLPPSYLREVVVKVIQPNLRNNKEFVFFDLGAGKGEVAEKIKSKIPKATVVASDLSRFALLDLKQRQVQGVEPVQMDGACLTLKDNSVDIIHCKDVIVHFHDLELFFKELHRVTKKNAKVILTFVPTNGYFMAGTVQTQYNFPLAVQSDYLEVQADVASKKGWFIGPPFYDTNMTVVQKATAQYFRVASKYTWTPQESELSSDWYENTNPQRIVLELLRK